MQKLYIKWVPRELSMDRFNVLQNKAKFYEFGFELRMRATYYSDLAPSNLFLSLDDKKIVAGKKSPRQSTNLQQKKTNKQINVVPIIFKVSLQPNFGGLLIHIDYLV